jgi:hypothetical protein
MMPAEVNRRDDVHDTDILLSIAWVFGAFAKFRKSTISFVMSACLSVRMEQLGSCWTDLNET